MGYGVIIRDDDGFVLAGDGGFIDKRVTVHEIECIAFEKGIELVCQLNINDDMLFETDHASLVNNMHNYGTDVSIISARIKDCKDAFNNFKSANLIWTNQSYNNIVDFICTKMC
ncbi:hypothetical protein Gohar_010364, partial [Gossypium harknessii]|nr:hypothetical protein [Gossypium harknessii]